MFQGKNLIKNGSDIELMNVSYSDVSNQWLSPPVGFSGQLDSYGRISYADDVVVTGSFGWIAAVYREESGNGPLFEWDGPRDTHIWILENKFYIAVERVGCNNKRLYKHIRFTTRVRNHQWYIMAVSYDLDADVISMWVDGQLVEKEMSLCARTLKTSSTAYINKKW